MADQPISNRVLKRMQRDLDKRYLTMEKQLQRTLVTNAVDLKQVYSDLENRLSDALENEWLKLREYTAAGNEPKIRATERRIKRMLQLDNELANDIATTGAKLQPYYTSQLAEQFKRSYYQSAHHLEQVAKVAVNVPMLSASKVLGLVANPWLPDGANYSDRLRANTAHLAAKLKDVMTDKLVTGASWNEAAHRLRELTDESYHNAVRLIRTENSRMHALGSSYMMMQNEDITDGKRWNATLDKDTAAKDRKNDGEVYDQNYDTPERPGVPGQRIPNHPHCRCKWTPVLSALGISKKRRIARDPNTGERTYTDARKYDDWAKQVGLPTSDDLAETDNLKKYLRPGETVADIGKKVRRYKPKQGGTIVVPEPPWVAGKPAVGSLPPIGQARTLAEAEEHARSLGLESASYTGIDLQVANACNENIKAVHERLPYAKKLLKHVNTGDLGKNINGNGGWGSITLDKSAHSKYSRYMNNRKAMIANKRSPLGTANAGATLTHEYGHVIQSALDDTVAGATKTIKRKTMKRVVVQAGANAADVQSGLSMYATTNVDEFFAEAFTEWIHNPNPRPIAKAFGEVLEEFLKDNKLDVGEIVEKLETMRDRIPPSMLKGLDVRIQDVFYTTMDDAPERFKKFAENQFANGIDVFKSGGGGNHYMQGAKYINLSKSTRDGLTGVNKRIYAEAVDTLHHEIGHGLDYGFNYSLSGRSHLAATVMDDDYVEAMQAARKKVKATITAANRDTSRYANKATVEKYEEAKAAAKEQIKRWQQALYGNFKPWGHDLPAPRSSAYVGGLSDIFESWTNCDRRGPKGAYGHGKAYWKRAGAAEKESFANLYEAYVQNKQDVIDFMDAEFPDVLKAFNAIIDRGSR